MATIKSYTDIEQSKKLAEILPLESADMYYECTKEEPEHKVYVGRNIAITYNLFSYRNGNTIPCWSLAALLNVLPEINGIPLTLEKVKAEDGYEGYYYHIEYKNKILIPYSKNPVDACVEMILKLHELNLL